MSKRIERNIAEFMEDQKESTEAVEEAIANMRAMAAKYFRDRYVIEESIDLLEQAFESAATALMREHLEEEEGKLNGKILNKIHNLEKELKSDWDFDKDR